MDGVGRRIYRFELKKLFGAKVNLIALTGAVIMLLVLSFISIHDGTTVSRRASRELNGSFLDAQLIEEMKTAVRYVKGSSQLDGETDHAKYGPILKTITAVVGDDVDLTRFPGTQFYSLREQKLEQRMQKQGLTEAEMEFWVQKERQVRKPFLYHSNMGPANLLRSFQALGFFVLILAAVGVSGVYAGETADNMNQLLLSSRFGRRELFIIKFAAGITWILIAAIAVFLAILFPVFITFGMEGTGEMLQLVKPLSMLPVTIGQMLAIYCGIYLLAAVLFASVTMLLSVLIQNSLAVTCGMLGYLLVDLFVQFPDKLHLLQKIWALRPNAILMNTGFANFRLFHLFGKLYLHYQAAPVLYFIIIVSAFLIGFRTYRKLQVGDE